MHHMMQLRALYIAVILLSGISCSYQALVWKEQGSGLDCSTTCGSGRAVSGPRRENSTYVPYLCAVNGSTFDTFNTGAQVGTLFYVSNVLSCWVYSSNPGGPSSTPHSKWYCLCLDVGDQISKATGSTAERCSSSCSSQMPGFNTTLTACQRPNNQSICFDQDGNTFGYQSPSSNSTDQSCLVASLPASAAAQSPPATRSASFDCLCLNSSSDPTADITSNCSTSSFSTIAAPPPVSPPAKPPVGPTPGPAKGSSLSAGAIAGIVVGGVAGLALLLCVAFFAIRVLRGRKHEGEASFSKLDPDYMGSQVTAPKTDDSTPPASSQIQHSDTTWEPITAGSNASSVIFTTVPYSEACRNSEAVGIGSIDVPSENPSSFEGLPSSWHIPIEQVRLVCSEGVPVQLGVGGFGMVLRGMVWNEEAALKTVKGGSPSEHARLLHEIKILESCRSRHIVQFFGYSICADGLLLCMEYLPGGNLYRSLGSDNEFQWWNRGRQAMQDVAAGLFSLHSRGLIHLDLKSPNLLITGDRRVKIADFGLGKLINGSETTATQIGTLAWTAPEVLLHGVTGPPTDIYALGTIIYEICTLKRASRSMSIDEVKVPDHAPEKIVSLIRACREAQPADRPTIHEVCEILESH